MLTRQNALHTWLNSLGKDEAIKLTPIAGDASFRRYFRLHNEDSSHVVMDAPPDKEGLLAFIEIAKSLANSGVRTPEIFAYDITQGFALIEDFGDALLLDDIDSERTSGHYERALDTLNHLQACQTESPRLPLFDLHTMGKELQLFRTWFLERWLQITLSPAEDKMLNHALKYITDDILKQPTCFMHSDYHSRNLALIGAPQAPAIGVLDFQDARIGPFSYDLVSLLKDAYVKWPKTTQIKWLNYFYDNMPNHAGWSRDAFEHGFHMTGLQRHLKILGIFCRLDQRDGKPNYLKDLPLTLEYINESLCIDTALRPFHDFLEERIYPKFLEKKIS